MSLTSISLCIFLCHILFIRALADSPLPPLSPPPSPSPPSLSSAEAYPFVKLIWWRRARQRWFEKLPVGSAIDAIIIVVSSSTIATTASSTITAILNWDSSICKTNTAKMSTTMTTRKTSVLFRYSIHILQVHVNCKV